MPPKNKLLILGSEGLIGTHLCTKLKGCNADVYTLDLSDAADFSYDVLDFDKLCEIFQKVQPTYVINLAALSSNRLCVDNPTIVFSLNTVLPAVLMQYMNLVGCKRLIHASTEWIYGPGSRCIRNGLGPEEYLTLNHDCYSRSKVEAEVLIKALAKGNGTAISLRLGIVYGSVLRNSNSIVDILIRDTLQNKPLSVRNRGAARCFVSVFDVCNSIINALDIDFPFPYMHLDIQGPSCHTLGSIIDYINSDVDELDGISEVSGLIDAKLIGNQSDVILGVNPTYLKDYIDKRLGRS